MQKLLLQNNQSFLNVSSIVFSITKAIKVDDDSVTPQWREEPDRL